ncbi:MAG TPA: zinc ribbon domain-containing protein [Casimicrobiaceae bacterium]|nr:zinc ribbon domain-containing protein [Casimicrobiaceae bacterium]
MPIYAYRCTSCGHQLDALQKLSDAALVDCPACAAPALSKLLTAPGFQLKGSGWYATDFKGGSKPKSDSDGAGSDAKSGAKTDAPATTEAKGGAAPAAASTGCGSGCSCH